MAEETVNVDMDTNLEKNKPDLAIEWGRLSNKAFFKAQQAIQNGEDVSLLSDNYKKHTGKDVVIRGTEIKEWGLDPDHLYYKKERDIELYEREIL